MWSTMVNTMPPAMIAGIDSMLQEEKVVFIYNCLNGQLIKENAMKRLGLRCLMVVDKKRNCNWYRMVL